jgi:hypothetical protein
VKVAHSASREKPATGGEEKVIPWAEGNGLWHTINRSVSDLAGVDVITFFVQNPYTCDTAESVAIRIGHAPATIEPALEGLAQAQLLKATELGDCRVYELTDDAHRRQTLQQYVSWLQEGFHWARMVLDQ